MIRLQILSLLPAMVLLSHGRVPHEGRRLIPTVGHRDAGRLVRLPGENKRELPVHLGTFRLHPAAPRHVGPDTPGLHVIRVTQCPGVPPLFESGKSSAQRRLLGGHGPQFRLSRLKDKPGQLRDVIVVTPHAPRAPALRRIASAKRMAAATGR